jgi:hypothetical protein
MEKKYLVELSQERESEAVKRFLELSFISEKFFKSLGLVPSFSWYLLQIRIEQLLSSMKGEVDILAGRLNRTDSGGFEWLPSTDYLIGIEAKCSYLPVEAKEITAETIKSKKSSPKKIRKIQLEIERMLQMGFDKVALLDIIANPPASGIHGEAWEKAANVSNASLEEMLPILQKRLPENSPAGHWVFSLGSVIGSDETKRGSLTLENLRRPSENPYLQKDPETRSRRKEIEKGLSIIFSKFPSSHRFPVIFIDCRSCGKIHKMEDLCKTVQEGR